MATLSKAHSIEHGLVARALHAADQVNARRILLVSAYSGDGKTHFAECISRHASSVTDEPVTIQDLKTPDLQCDRGYLWLDGLALLEGEGPSALTPSFRASIDGAIFIARGLATTREEAAECAERLRVLGVKLLGGAWNERDHPPADEALSRLKADLWKWPPQFVPEFIRRQLRRSS